MTLIERQIDEILERKEKEWQQANSEREEERKKIIRVGEKLIRKAAVIFKDVDEFREATIEQSLPVLGKKWSRNESINFSLSDTLIEVNFFPNKTFNNYMQFSLTLINPDATLEQLSVNTYHASSDNPVHRIRASRSDINDTQRFDGAKAALKGLLMLRKISKLNRDVNR
jgi:hypothetical protein